MRTRSVCHAFTLMQSRISLRPIWTFLAIALFGIALNSVSAADDGPRVNDVRTLRSTLGQPIRLSDLPPHKAMVLAFLDPLQATNEPIFERMKKLEERYRKDEAIFVAVYSDPNVSIPVMAAHATDIDLDWIVLVDTKNQLAGTLGLTFLSTFCLLDGKGQLLYRGELGAVPPTRETADPNSKSLVYAIDKTLAGKPIDPIESDGNGRPIEPLEEDYAAPERTYERNIRPIFEAHCQSCHRRDGLGSFSLDNYRGVISQAKEIDAVVRDYRMPPWYADERYGKFSNDPQMTKQERRIILEWLASRKLQGGTSSPAAKSASGRWLIDAPDAVLETVDAIPVPAEGASSSVRIELQKGAELFKEDRWIQAIEALPTSSSVTRSIQVFIVPPGKEPPTNESPRPMGAFAWIPGNPAYVFPTGTAYRVEAGSRVFLDVETVPNGKEAKERPSLAMKFAKEPPTEEVKVEVLRNDNIEIPSDQPHAVGEMLAIVETTSHLLGVVPFMNDAGYYYRFSIEVPREYEKVLLSIPRFDPKHQLCYWLTQRESLPKTSNMRIQARFANSKHKSGTPNSTQDGKSTGGVLATWVYLTVPVTVPSTSTPLLKQVSSSSELDAAGSLPEQKLKLIATPPDLAKLEPLKEGSPHAIRVVPNKGGGKSESVQLMSPALKVSAENVYVARFRAKADRNRTIWCSVGKGDAPVDRIAGHWEVSIGPEMRSYLVAFPITKDENNATIRLELGNDETPVEIESFTIEEVVSPKSLPFTARSMRPGSIILKRVDGTTNRYRVDVSTHAGPDSWTAGISYDNLSFAVDDPIEIAFRARSDGDREINVALKTVKAPEKNMGLFGRGKLTRHWEEFTFRGKCTVASDEGQLVFFLGESVNGVEIEDVIIRRSGLRIWIDEKKNGP